ncbi:UNVERIFIED_CONTAM: glycosyltransferase involved in cell wall biosynthesis [Williamsia faeni]
MHERLTEIAGSEHVVEQLAHEWPKSKLFVPFADPAAVNNILRDRVITGPLDHLYRATGRRSYAPLLPLVPTALRRIDYGDVDAIIISHHAMALSAVRNAGSTPTIAYVHSPARWAWDPAMRAGEASGIAGKSALSLLARIARRAESTAAPKITTVVANSTEVADRIRRWWNRESTVVHPPVDTERYSIDPNAVRDDFFLLAGRLVPYKRPEIAIAAAEQAGVRLIVAGSGRLADDCRKLAGPTTVFLGRVTDAEMLSLQRRAQALLMPGVEDFGIVPVEAMGCGTPVLAVDEGGALDTVIPGLSGELIPNGSDDALIDALAAAMSAFDAKEYDHNAISDHAQQFSRANFRKSMRDIVEAQLR